MFRRLVLALGLLLVPAGAAHAVVVQVTSNIAASTSWGLPGSGAAVQADVIWVRNSIAVNSGVTLTVHPGVVIKFDLSRSFTVNGRLRCLGTPADTVVWTSIRDDNNRGGDTNGDGNVTVPANSDWTGVNFPDASPDNSSFYYCDIRYAGTFSSGALTFVSASDSVVNSVIRRSYYGIDCQGSAAPVLQNTSIEASTSTPIVLDFTAAPVFSSLVFSSANNGYDAFGLRGGTLTSPTSLPQRGATIGASPISNVTYVLLSALTIASGGSLTISPGVVIKPSSSLTITVNAGGTLTMNGTAPSNITITSIHDDNFGLPSDTNNNGSISAPNRGDWGRIDFADGANGSLQHCRLKFGSNSASQGMVEMLNNAIPVSNCLLSDAAHSLMLKGVSTPVITSTAINNCSSTPVLMSVAANPTFTGITLLANAFTAIGLINESIAVNSRLYPRALGGFTNITYAMLNGSITMLSGATLRIDPGIVIKSGGCTGLFIEGGLIADAKPESLITFTSILDDQFGNPADSNGDGSITTPNTSNWGYIRFNPTSDDVNCRLDWCRVTFGSSDCSTGNGAAIWALSASPTITNCFISKTNWGIRIEGNAAPVIADNSINNCTNAPFLMSVLSDPTYTNNSFSTNGYNAIGLLSETLSQNATLEYRPTVPGLPAPPYAYLPIGTITVASGVTLAVEPQVVIKPTSSFDLFQVDGALNMVGSGPGAGRIIVTSVRDDAFAGDTNADGSASAPAAGHWGNIVFNDTAVDPACILRNVLFQFGSTSNTDGVLETFSASPRCSRLEFFQNSTVLTCRGQSQPVLDSLTILNCTQLPLVWSMISDPVIPAPARITFANNTYTCIGILGETLAQDVTTRVRPLAGNPNMVYALASDVTIAFGAKWTIAPGVVIKFGRVFNEPTGNNITINGALVADGKPDSLIIFTSSADDAFGGDFRNDGALTQPAVSQWGGITFTAVSNDTTTVIDHCRFRFGGYSSDGTLRFQSAGPTVTNTTVTSTYIGATSEGNASPIFTNVNFDSCTNVPIYMSLVSTPTFNNVQFLGNAYTALGVIPETIAQDLLWPIRALAGRQNMPYLLQGSLTIGLGATVTMQPGVRVKMNGSGNLTVQRAFFAEGRTNPESLVVFTSFRDDFYGGDTNNDGATSAPGASDWGRVTIEGTAIDPQVRFKNCVFRYGGSGALRAVNSSPTADSCLFMFNQTGVAVEGASNPVVRGSTFVGNTSFGINNTGNSFCVNAEGCWWGAASGPTDASAAGDLCGIGSNAGLGDDVSNNVDYMPFATSGIVNPLLGDVSLNGQVLAFDASLILQFVVGAPLNNLQRLVAEVSGVAPITAFDASLVLQYVAGLIPAFPAASNAQTPGPREMMSAFRMIERAKGSYGVTLGTPIRDGAAWRVPVEVSGGGPLHGLELALAGAGAAALTGVDADAAGLVAFDAGLEGAEVAIAWTETAGGVVAHLTIAADGDAPPELRLASARVNENEQIVSVPAPGPDAAPAVSFLGRPAPNPARGAARISLAIAPAEAGAMARVQIVDLAGREVRRLHDGPLAVGVHALSWDLRDTGGRAVPAGIYFVRAIAGRFGATHRLVVVR